MSQMEHDAFKKDWPSNILGQFSKPNAVPVDDINASELTHEIFQRKYVDRSRPCIIRNATCHWPAFQRWTDPQYLTGKIGSVKIKHARTMPFLEHRWRAMWGNEWKEQMKQDETAVRSYEREFPFDEFLERIRRLEFVWTHSVSIDKGGKYESLGEDVGGFPFLAGTRPPVGYSQARVFFYGRSYTDWHAHQVDETLMCQIGSPKQVAIAGPDLETFDAFMEVLKSPHHYPYIGSADPALFPRFFKQVKHVFTVEPGDATYIPPRLWHAVETVENPTTFGATVAYCWRSPNHILLDPRFPFNQFIFWNLYPIRMKMSVLKNTLLYWVPQYLMGRALSEVPHL